MRALTGSVIHRNDNTDPTTNKDDLNAAINALVSVRDAANPVGTGLLANVFDINAVPIANPITSDDNGNYVVYVVDGTYDLITNEGLINETIQEGVYVGTQLEVGNIGSPHLYETLYGFVNNLPYGSTFSNGDWIQFSGRTVKDDGNLTRYQVTDTPPTALRNYENYIPVNGDGDLTGVTLWAVLVDGFKRDFGEQDIEIIAHRSFNNAGIGNTSFNDSLAVGHDIQSLETDVQVPLDATTGFDLVRFHDATVDSTTDGTGAISSLTLAQVRALTFTQLSGTILADRVKVSRFDSFVKFAKSVGARIYPEIKQYRTAADIQLMVDVIEYYNYESMTVLQSFTADDLVEVRRINKRVGVGWLTTNINTTQEYIDFDKIQKLKYADVLMSKVSIISFPSLVSLIYDAGMGCVAWGLNNNTDIKEVLRVGVFRQMLDQPQLIASVRGLKNVNY